MSLAMAFSSDVSLTYTFDLAMRLTKIFPESSILILQPGKDKIMRTKLKTESFKVYMFT